MTSTSQRLVHRSRRVVDLNVPGRDPTQCQQRWNTSLAPSPRKGVRSAHEDAKLTEKVTELSAQAEGLGLKFSNIHWGEVCKAIPGRSAKQCRERWVNNLDPAIRCPTGS